ncbi:hypothetical protein AABC73_00585 [Pseudomonas sp. G.S.17]|uniref:hypothetical protein n=1 Tax=Pseudomonas sp. G.S.17 TaxID=3137451 RepID=UPI00311CBF41
MASDDSGAVLQPEPSENDPQLADVELFQGAEVMAWRIKAHPHLVFPVDAMFGTFGVMVGMLYLYGQFHESEIFRENTTGSCVLFLCF